MAEIKEYVDIKEVERNNILYLVFLNVFNLIY